MLYRSFKIPCGENGQAEQNINAFLSSHRIISVQKEFYAAECCWCILVEYADESFAVKSGAKVDYMKILSQEEFSVFSKLRELRKKIATEERIPAYAVFTDEQLSHLVKSKPKDVQQMQKISGVGSNKAEKYGDKFLALLNGADDEPDIF
ncbi:MAG: HRDC domain-containing protein [Treponema sp.]|nr:HRDC domain-containing protein [Treponema sp.]